jgi:hypothetical protein
MLSSAKMGSHQQLLWDLNLLYIKVHEHKNICVYIYMNIDGASV